MCYRFSIFDMMICDLICIATQIFHSKILLLSFDNNRYEVIVALFLGLFNLFNAVVAAVCEVVFIEGEELILLFDLLLIDADKDNRMHLYRMQLIF